MELREFVTLIINFFLPIFLAKVTVALKSLRIFWDPVRLETL